MENMVVSGVATLNQSLLVSSLQTAFNFRQLPELLQSLVHDLTETVQMRIQSTFGVSRIQRSLILKVVF
ncbi:hypothetical protein JB92DRAFT_2944600, partial [Gautieria morchelliformis]